MRNLTRITATVLALALATVARAETIDASATTFLYAGQQTRGGPVNQPPQLATVVPLFEILSVSASGIRNPVSEDLDLVLNMWGSWDLADHRWDNGTNASVTGDVVTGYLKAKFLDRHLTLRLGRETISAGNAQMIQIDGGDVVLALPYFGVSGFVGSPVSQRFQSRNQLVSWNPVAGTLAYGGRVYVQYPMAGFAGRGIEIGGSTVWVTDGANTPVRQDVGLDGRIALVRDLTLQGYGNYSIYDQRYVDGSLLLDWNYKKFHVNVDWRYVAPDLLLSRSSILSVFSAERRNDYGAGVFYDLSKEWLAGAAYHLVVEPGKPGQNYYGDELLGRVTWTHALTKAGAEVDWLNSFDNGYWSGRIWGRQDYGKAFAALDLYAYFFRVNINGQPNSFTGVLSAGYDIGQGWAAVLAGSAGVNPYFEQQYQLMAKLTYNQTYHVREVR